MKRSSFISSLFAGFLSAPVLQAKAVEIKNKVQEIDLSRIHYLEIKSGDFHQLGGMRRRYIEEGRCDMMRYSMVRLVKEAISYHLKIKYGPKFILEMCTDDGKWLAHKESFNSFDVSSIIISADEQFDKLIQKNKYWKEFKLIPTIIKGEYRVERI